MKQVYSKDITDQEYLITLDSELHSKKLVESSYKQRNFVEKIPCLHKVLLKSLFTAKADVR